MTTSTDQLSDIDFKNSSTIQIVNGSKMKVTGYGSAYISSNIVIHNVLYVSKCQTSLLYVSSLSTE